MTAKKKSTSSKTSSTTDAKLSWLPKKTFELTITIPDKEVQKAYQKTLAETAKATTIKGFRKGKAPLKMVEGQVGRAKLFEQAAQKLVTLAYQAAVKQHNLQPIISPKIEPVSMQEGKDWQFTAISCESPEVKLGDYKQAIKGIKAKNAIWTPDKAGQGDQKPQDKNARLEQILTELLKNSQVEISDLVIEKETNRLMTSLLEQVNSLGMTVQQYLESKNMTQQQLKVQYQKTAEDTLKLDFIIPKVADTEKIEVTDTDFQTLLKKTQDEKTKQQMQDPAQKYYLMFMLRKQKTVDFLQNL